jgi:hypothetical protein
MPDGKAVETVQPVFRHVHGEQFDLLLECIEDRIADEPRLRLEGRYQDDGGPMLFAATARELQAPANHSPLADLSLSREEFMRRIAEKVPTIRKERPVSFTQLSHTQTRRGVHFFEFELDGPSLEEAVKERRAVWYAMQDVAGARLNWGAFASDVTVVYGSNRPERLTSDEVEPLKTYLEAHMPLNAMLTRVVGAPE